MLHKSFQLLETKADGDDGEFTAIVSTFGNVDRVGDRILPGAWTKTLEKWRKSGDPLPIILAHQWADPFAHVGVARPEDVKQVAKGLQVTAKLDVDDNPLARQVYKLMKRRSLKEFSIGYNIPQGGEKTAKDGVNEISEIDLAECGPCLIGIDPKTELQSVKAALDATNAPDPEVLKKEADRVTREAEEALIPEVPPAEPKAEEPKPDLAQDLQEVNARLETLEKAFENLTKAAEVTDKEPKARSVDPLRGQADEVALKHASGGLSLEKPPAPKAPPPRPDLVPLDELKQRMRDDMLIHLNGDIE